MSWRDAPLANPAAKPKWANAPLAADVKQQTAAEVFQNEHPVIRTLGRAGRAVASGLASSADLALLVPKTAAIGAGMVAENMGASGVGKSLQRFGMMPSMADSAREIVDQATGGRLKPTGTIDRVGDFLGEAISSGAPFSRYEQAATAIKPPTAKDAVAAVVNPQGLFTKKAPPKGIDALRDAKNAKYAQARQAGGSWNDQIKQELAAAIESNRYKDPLAKGIFGGDEIDNIATNLQDSAQHKMTLDSFEAIDKRLGAKGNVAYRGGDNDMARRLDNVQEALRNLATDPKYIEGSGDGIKAYRDATKLASLNFIADDVEEVLRNAKTYVAGEGAGIRAGFSRLAKSKKFAGYPPEVQKMVERAARTGNLDGPLAALGNRLFAIGSAVKGGPMGALIGYGTSESGRAGVAAVKNAQANKITDYLLNEAAKVDPSILGKKALAPINKNARATAIGIANYISGQTNPSPFSRTELARIVAQTR